MDALSDLWVNFIVFFSPLTCYRPYNQRWKELIRFRRGPTVSDITDKTQEMITLERKKVKGMPAIATILGFSTLTLWLIYRSINHDLFYIVLGCCCIGATQLIMMNVIKRGLKHIGSILDEGDNVASEGDLSSDSMLPEDTLSGTSSNVLERGAPTQFKVMAEPNEAEVMPEPNEAGSDASPQFEVMPEPNEAVKDASPQSVFMPKPNEEQREALMRLENFVIAIKNTPPATLAIYGPAVTDMLDVIQATDYPTELFKESFAKIISLSIQYVRASLRNSTAPELKNGIHYISPTECKLRKDSKHLMTLKSHNAEASERIIKLQAQLKQLLDVRNALDAEISILTESIEDLHISQEKFLRRMDALERRIAAELKEHQQADIDFELHESDYLDSIHSSIEDLIASLESLL
ncbi:hypothetical protein MRB53_014983 [Persea americana]|uniref:Uncharacterized protein n=1 Tax=Persea americana TaxID=3435 RepID=A0ACC2KCU8_PERAE|nr:hypothetical protein MRB53_014983 [Persea americana]